MSVKSVSAPRSGERLAARRRRNRRRAGIVFLILFLMLLAAALYGLRQPAVRVSQVEVFASDALRDRQPALAAIALSAMRGSYLGLIPRDSTFFIPEARIRGTILAEYDDVAAVSIFRKGFDGLVLKVIDRAPVARWCGSTGSPQATSGESCYVFDASGVVYAAADTVTETINAFVLYAPLDPARDEPPAVSAVEPLGATIAQADMLPATFDLARELAKLGSSVVSIAIAGDEVTDILASGTRLVYVLGREQAAYAALVSAKNNLNLSDGSLEYVDLRFDRKVYLKRKAEAIQEIPSAE